VKSDVAPDLDLVLGGLPSHGDLAVVRDGAATVIGLRPDRVLRANGADAFRALDSLERGWWAGVLGYDLGRAVERVPDLNSNDLGLPDLLLARFRARIVCEPHDVRIEGEDDHELERLLTPDAHSIHPQTLTGWRSSLDRNAWEHAVGRILAHLRAGDCYQVNLTRRLSCDVAADPIALFRALALGNPAPHAALVRIGDVAVVSASPERFLRRDGSAIETRPIKGTSADPVALERSEKDRAENVMIVDLARNDLGRVCEYGSIDVRALCELEEHPGLYHLVSTVKGTLRKDASLGDIVRATFPPASVTGCPKPRVLDIIERLEPVRRGVYCGAIGFLDTQRDVLDLNVAIRTFTIAGGRTYFGVGGGIVADSDPGAEWEETELKAARLLRLAAGGT
jgi:para-aminobenzoate synthetase component 1